MAVPPLPPGFTLAGGLPAGFEVVRTPSNRPVTDYIDAAKESGLSDREEILHNALRMAREENNPFAEETLKGQLGVARKADLFRAKQKVAREVREMGIPGGAAAATVAGAKEALGQVGNLVGLVSDEDYKAAREEAAPLVSEHPGAALLGHSAVSLPPSILAAGPAGAARGVGFLGRLANVARQTAGGAAAGYAFSPPGERGTNATIGGGLNFLASAAANPLHALAKSSENRASRTATRMFAQSPQDLAQIEEAVQRRAGQAMPQRQAYEQAGRTLRDLKVTRPFVSASDRADQLVKLNQQAGRELDAVLAEADSLGITIDKDALNADLLAEYRRMFPKSIANAPGDVISAQRELSKYLKWIRSTPGHKPGTLISKTEELKRLLQREAKFTSSDRNLTPGSPDTMGQAGLKNLSRIVREHVERAIEGQGGPDLMERFLNAKQLYGTTSAFTPMAEQATRKGFLGMGEWAGASPSGMFFRSAVQTLKRPIQPLGIKGSEALDWLYRKTPTGTDAKLQAFLANALRNPNYEGEPNAP